MSGFSIILPEYKDASDGSSMYLQYIVASLNLISEKLEKEELLYPQKKSEKAKILVDISKINILKSCLLTVDIKEFNDLIQGLLNSITIYDSTTEEDFRNIFAPSFHKMFRQIDVSESIKNPMRIEVATNNAGGSTFKSMARKLAWEDNDRTLDYELIENDYYLNVIIDNTIYSLFSDYLFLPLSQICNYVYTNTIKEVS